MMNFDISGFDELQKQLDNLQNEINKAVEGKAQLNEVFTNEFMSKFSKFNTIDEFFEKSPFTVKTIEDYKAIDEKELDPYVKENTSFDNWNDFSKTAGNLYTKKKLKQAGFDVE